MNTSFTKYTSNDKSQHVNGLWEKKLKTSTKSASTPKYKNFITSVQEEKI
jgi:hypothetical protein